MAEADLTDRGWTEPIDDSNIDTPDGWYHGAVVHTGGGIYNRVWKTSEEWSPNLGVNEVLYEVGYDGGFRGASLQKYVHDEEQGCRFAEVVATREPDEHTDTACAETARELMLNVDELTDE